MAHPIYVVFLLLTVVILALHHYSSQTIADIQQSSNFQNRRGSWRIEEKLKMFKEDT